VERASSSDAFGLLGLPAQFDLDQGVIEQAFFERSKELHADRYASAPAAERVAALSRSRALNDAYQTLKKPIARAEYLLERAGVKIGDNERLDPGFLEDILEMREQLAEARAAKRLEHVGQCQKQMALRKQSVLDELPALFAAGELAKVKDRLILLRYIQRYLDECDAALDEEE
jgi:molecular chaperone HscB